VCVYVFALGGLAYESDSATHIYRLGAWHAWFIAPIVGEMGREGGVGRGMGA